MGVREDGGEGAFRCEVQNSAGHNGRLVGRRNLEGTRSGGILEDVLGSWDGVGGGEGNEDGENGSEMHLNG